jgi:hypothetical protein
MGQCTDAGGSASAYRRRLTIWPSGGLVTTMAKLVIQNDTPYRLTPASRKPYGNSWYDLPKVNEIAPGAAVYVAGRFCRRS